MTENTPPPSVAASAPVIAPVHVIAGPDPQSMSADDDEISLLDLLQVVADNLRLLVLGPLAAGLLALAYSFTITPTFTATTKFMPPQQQQSGAAAMLAGLGALGGLAGAAGIKSPADQYVAFLKSRSVQDAIVDRFKLLDHYETKFREDVIQVLDAAQPPERKSKPKKAQMAMLASFAVGFALLLYVFVRKVLGSAGQTPKSAAKLKRLRQSLAKALGWDQLFRA